MDSYKMLKLEFNGIEDLITDYTDNAIVTNHLKSLRQALKKDAFDEVLYFLDQICDWYEREINEIYINDFVYDKESHTRNKKLLERIKEDLNNYDFNKIVDKINEINVDKINEINIYKKISISDVDSNKVFIVHGHDNAAKESVVRFLEKIDMEAIILHEQADKGKTIIEKIEEYTDVAFAIVLYTPCDLGRAKNESKDKMRARQNVVFEHGYLIGKLGRNRVCALVKDNVETPGDISGVVYKKMDDNKAWMYEIYKEMKAAGIQIDANKLF